MIHSYFLGITRRHSTKTSYIFLSLFLVINTLVLSKKSFWVDFDKSIMHCNAKILEFFKKVQSFRKFLGLPGYTLRFLASIETTLIPINEILKKNLGTLYLEILTNHRQNEGHFRASNWLFWAVSCLYFLLCRWWGLIILTNEKKFHTPMCISSSQNLTTVASDYYFSNNLKIWGGVPDYGLNFLKVLKKSFMKNLKN